MKQVVNSVTGVTETHFDCKIISIGEKVLQNTNDTEYVVSTVEFKNSKGETVQRSALLYVNAANAGNVSVGQTTNCRALPPRDGSNEVLLILDPINATARATADDFAFEVKNATTGTAAPIGAGN